MVTGALGNTMLGYIIPSWIHIILGKQRLDWLIITKDVTSKVDDD